MDEWRAGSAPIEPVVGAPAVTIDGRWLNTGIGTYTRNIVRNLKRCGPLNLRVVTLPEHAEELRPYCDEVTTVDARMYGMGEQFKIARAAAKSDLLHILHYNIPVMHRGPIVVTIHDLTHIVDPGFQRTLKSLIYARPMLHLASHRAEHIITVSEYSKRRIVEQLGVSPGKVTVMHCGVNSEFYPENHDEACESINRQLGFSGRYILYLGNLKPHKNVEGLLRAYVMLRSRTELDEKLLIVGDDASGRSELMRLAGTLKVDTSAVFVPWLAQESIRTLYSGASVTVLPSFEEGFGLPVLESMACGVPVACSRVASMPEVGGSAVEYFDPYDVESIACSIEKVLSSSERQGELRRLGLEQARRFDWGVCARQHFALYEGLLS